MLCFPRVLVQLVCLKGGAHHDFGRGCVVQMSLDTLPQGVELFARQAQLARQTHCGLVLGNSPEEDLDGSKAPPGLRKDGPSERGRAGAPATARPGGSVGPVGPAPRGG